MKRLNDNQLMYLRMYLSPQRADNDLTAIEAVIASTLCEFNLFPQTRSELSMCLHMVPEECLEDIRRTWIKVGRSSVLEAMEKIRSTEPENFMILRSYLEYHRACFDELECDRSLLEVCYEMECDRVS